MLPVLQLITQPNQQEIMISKMFITALTSLLVCISINSHAGYIPELTKNLHSYLSIRHQKAAFPDSMPFEKGIGQVSLEHYVPPVNSSSFAITSIAKTFTAALESMAHDEGPLNLDDKSGQGLPGHTAKLFPKR